VLNPIGVIKSRSDGYIQIVFKPLEAIDYEVSALFLVNGGNNFPFSLSGRGIHTGYDECDVVWPIFPPTCLGIHNVYNALAVISLALDVGIHIGDIKKGLENFNPLPQRGQIIHINEIILLNDSYNSSPDSVKASVNLLKFVKSEGKTIAVMADMLELGVRSKEIHFEIGKYLALSGIDIIITIGKAAESIGEGAREAKSNTIIFECENNIQAAEILLKNISKGDKILVKGSRGMKTEEIIDLFLAGL
jgi:UDP-N-acetylmuramoyl-tripeptide--D-alanyl-D-alanine ligase